MGKTGGWRLTTLGMAAALLVCALLLPAGCGEKAAEETIEQQMEEAMGSEEADVDVDIKDDESGTISISGTEGDAEVAFGGAAQVPDGFPQELVPDGAKIEYSMNVDEAEGVAQTVTFTSDADVNEMYEWFVEALPKAGYEVEHKMQMDADEGRAFSIAGSGSATGCTVTGTESEGQFVGSVIIFSN